MKNLYEILGVDQNASEEDIKKAYRAISKANHPDTNKEGSEESIQLFREATQAYEVLGDSKKRKSYDRHGFEVDEQFIKKEAESVFINLYETIYGQVPINNIEYTDMKELMTEGVEDSIHGHRRDIEEMKIELVKISKAVDKIIHKSNGQNNLLSNMLREREKGVRGNIENKKKIILVLEEVGRIIEDYDFIVLKKPSPYNNDRTKDYATPFRIIIKP